MAQEFKDKIAPHNEDAERAALGAMLLDNEAVAAALPLLDHEDFYSPANGKVYKAICALNEKGANKPDILTVCDELQREGQLDSAGGEAYVAALTNVVPTTANIGNYIELIKDCSLRRSVIRACSKLSASAYDISIEARESLEEAQKTIFSLIEKKQRHNFRPLKDVYLTSLKWIDEVMNNEYTGVTTGFTEIDKLTSGFQKSEMVVIGARPSIGKTALALNMAQNIAIIQRKPAAFFSLEMPEKFIGQRILASEAEVNFRDLYRIRNTQMQENEFNKILAASDRSMDAPLFIEDMPNMRLFDLRTQARHACEVHKVEIIFIDYLGLIAMDNIYQSRYEQVSEISRSIKSLARELDIPIVVLSQLARSAEGNKPNLAEIRESGAIEQDADVVLLMNRDRNKKEDDPDPDSSLTEIEVAKNRNGATGRVTLVFYPKHQRFKNYGGN